MQEVANCLLEILWVINSVIIGWFEKIRDVVGYPSDESPRNLELIGEKFVL